MSTCVLNEGMTLGCRNTGGGSTKLYLASFSGSTVWSADVNNILTGVTGNNTFYEFVAPQGVIDISEAFVGSTENYNVSVTQTVNSYLGGIAQNEADLISLMGQGPLLAIAKHSSGIWVLLGYENGLWMNAATRNYGKAKTDAVSISFTLTGAEDVFAPEVSAALLTTLGIS